MGRCGRRLGLPAAGPHAAHAAHAALLGLLGLLVLLGWCAGPGVRAAPAKIKLPSPTAPASYTPTPPRWDGPSRRQGCTALPVRLQRQILGEAYYPAQMAFSLEETMRQPRRTDPHSSSFWVVSDDDFSAEIGSESEWRLPRDYQEAAPVTTVYHDPASAASARTSRRTTSCGPRDFFAMTGSADERWHCDAPTYWKDLTADYIPRYLLSADCTRPSCSWARECKPNSVLIKVLRRRDRACDAPPAEEDHSPHESEAGLPSDLRKNYVWEYRAATFGCKCRP